MDAYIHEAQQDGDLFIIRFSGCDFKCRACNVPHLVEFNTGEILDTRQVEAQLDLSGAQRVIVTGGEPLLQRQALLELLRHARKKGLRTILDTNIAKPEAVKALIDEKLVDEWLVDIKAARASFGRATRAGTFFIPDEQVYEDVKRSLALLRKAQKETLVTFKTLIVPGLVYRKEEILEIAALLEGFDCEWTLEPFNPAVTLDTTLKGVAPPTRKFLENLAEFAAKEHPKLQVRVGEGLAPPPQPKSPSKNL